MKKRILVDMDGVLVEIARECARIARIRWTEGLVKGHYSLSKMLGVDVEWLRAQCKQEGVHFWTDAHWTPFGERLMKQMWRWAELGHTVAICTDASWTPYAPEGKHEWLHEHGFKDLGPRVLTREKWLLAQPGAILIDDSPKQVEDFRACGGHAVLVPRLWNDGGEQPAEDTFRYIRSQVEHYASRPLCHP